MANQLHTLNEYFLFLKDKSYIESYFINPSLSKWDFIVYILLFIFLIVLRLLISGINNKVNKAIFFDKLFKYTLLDRINTKWNIVKEGQLYKWKENMWFTFWHTFSFACNFILLLSMSGLLTGKNGWVKMCIKEPTGKWLFLVTEDEFNENKKGWPFMYTNDFIRYFYLIQISFWSSCIFFLNFEKRRKDFYVYILHHVSTTILLFYSHLLNFWRVGLIILIIHDIVDIFLYLSKTLNYSNIKNQMYLTTSYILFVLSYFFLRIILYFYYIVLPLSNMKIIKSYTDGLITAYSDVNGGTLLIFLLWGLMFMHFYWFYLIIKMTHLFVSKLSKKEEIGDIRSDDEDDDTTVDSVKKK